MFNVSLTMPTNKNQDIYMSSKSSSAKGLRLNPDYCDRLGDVNQKQQ
jgi:hypothetical protein